MQFFVYEFLKILAKNKKYLIHSLIGIIFISGGKMMRYIAIAIFSLLVFASCDKPANQAISRFYDDGRSRPVIAVSTVIDSTAYDLPWSLSEEFSHLIKNNLQNHKNLYLSSSDDIDSSLTNSDNPFDVDVSWMKDRFEPNEFLVFLELVRHDEMKKETITNLDMTMRVRIIDVRAKQPKVILQECITDNYYIAKGAIKADYQTTIWGSAEYQNSRMGMAHQQLARQIVARISDYIALAKSR